MQLGKPVSITFHVPLSVRKRLDSLKAKKVMRRGELQYALQDALLSLLGRYEGQIGRSRAAKQHRDDDSGKFTGKKKVGLRARVSLKRTNTKSNKISKQGETRYGQRIT